MTRTTKAFVLTGGGSLGAVHVGMLEALYERGIEPDLIIGTSVGAINGAYVASRPQTPETARSLGDVWRGLRRADVYPVDFLAGFLGFAGRTRHLVPNRSLRRLLRAHVEFNDLAEAAIPVMVVATDITTGEEVLLTRGDAVTAVLASAAIPGVFQPVSWEDRLLVDGGVSNFAPISHALDMGADTIYVLTSGTACGLREPPKGAIPLFLHASSLLVTNRLAVELRFLRNHARFVVLPPPCPQWVAPHDFGHAASLISASYETAAGFLDSEDPANALPLPSHLVRLGHRDSYVGSLNGAPEDLEARVRARSRPPRSVSTRGYDG